ncbi:zinc finger protein 583-like [Cryptotermes secundus]|uniref:zinc finger protein 583-like n=1 Tax=Cryptotermes secundus TaxID=105785 RepID=UPI001454C2B3|nr:zinc finger protein 583-like [Cryptotermes secundus]
MNIKAEEVSDSQEEVKPVQITVQEIKAEPESCRNLENALVGPYAETYPTPHDADQAMNVKAEAVSDAEEEEDPLQITVQEVKAESEGNLNEFQPIHGEERQYSCNECGDSFSQEKILIAHQHIHSGEQPFCCFVCNNSFSQQSSLKAHQRVHSWKKPYCCDVCKKSFRKPSHLKTHQRLHNITCINRVEQKDVEIVSISLSVCSYCLHVMSYANIAKMGQRSMALPL